MKKIKDNQGSSLILVVIAISFISLLGVLILSLTMTNLQIKQIDYNARETFYDSEGVVDELRARLADCSSLAIQESYENVMKNYASYSSSGSETLKKQFEKGYINSMLKQIGISEDATGTKFDPDAYTDTDHYNFLPSKLQTLLVSTKYDGSIKNQELAISSPENIISLKYNPSNLNNSLLIKGVKIGYVSAKTSYETTIETDIEMKIPDLGFVATRLMSPFMDYSLIADGGLTVNGGVDCKPVLKGNVYAGAMGTASSLTGGIQTMNQSQLRIQKNGESLSVISRLDLTAENGTKIYIGDDTDKEKVDVWVRNIETKRGGTDPDKLATIIIKGNTNVEDDTILNAPNSNIAFNGNYNGFSYNRTNTLVANPDYVTSSDLSAKYSSAIYINGYNSRLNMGLMTSVQLAGRAYISRNGGTGGNDIPMGESISVKSNQIVYLIPREYLSSGINPTIGTTATVKEGDIPSVIKDLLGTPKYTKNVHQIGSGDLLTYYYWNFKSQDAANQYFRYYYETLLNKDVIDSMADKYVIKEIEDPATGNKINVDGVELGSSSAFHLSGYALKFEADNGSSIFAHPVPMNNLNLNYYKQMAIEYRCLQESLMSSLPAVNATNYRYAADNKALTPLYRNIMSKAGSEIVFEKEANSTDPTVYGFYNPVGKTFMMKKVEVSLADGSTGYAYFIKNNSEIKLSDIPGFDVEGNRRGIIIASGALNVDRNFEGVVFSGDKVRIISTGIELTSNVTLVQDVVNGAIDRETNGTYAGDVRKIKISHYFDPLYSEMDASDVEVKDINVLDYITFSNWKKNVE